MRIPKRLPGLKAATVTLVLYAAIWISLEGAVWRVTLLGLMVASVAVANLLQRALGGTRISFKRVLLLGAGVGLSLGITSGVLTLLFMGIKTGIHGHGPEFSAKDMIWVLRQIPVWAGSGLFAGLGLALILPAVIED